MNKTVKVNYDSNQKVSAVTFLAQNNPIFEGNSNQAELTVESSFNFLKAKAKRHIESGFNIDDLNGYFTGTAGLTVSITSAFYYKESDEYILDVEFTVDPGIASRQYKFVSELI